MYRTLMVLCRTPACRRYTSAGYMLNKFTAIYQITTSTRCVSNIPEFPIVDENVKKTGVDMIFPGYTYDDLDRYGHVPMHKVARLAEDARMHIYLPEFSGRQTYSNFTSTKILGEEVVKKRLIFLLAADYYIKPSFYDKAHIYNPLKITEELVNFGKSSYQHKNTVYSLINGEMLHDALLQVVLCDKESRRPAPLTDIMSNHFKNRADSMPFNKIEKVEKPDTLNTIKYKVQWSDADFYMHINHASYIRIVFDAITEVGINGRFSQLRGDVAQYWVKNLKCLYLKEGNPGDVLDVHLWEDDSDSYAVYASVERADDVIFQCRFSFTDAKHI